MFKYDKATNTLRIYTYENSEELSFDLFRDQLESYKTYLTKTIHDDVQYLIQQFQKKYPALDVHAEVRVDDLYESNYAPSLTRIGAKYYPISVTFSERGTQRTAVVFRVPFMDNECKLNVDGQMKVCIIEQRPSADISYNDSKQEFVVQTSSISFTFKIKKSGAIQFKKPDGLFEDAVSIIRGWKYLLIQEQDYVDESIESLDKLFMNYSIRATGNLSEEFNEDLFCGLYEPIYQRLCGDYALLGETREYLNEVLQIDDCLSEVLSRDILYNDSVLYRAGDVVTSNVLDDLKSKRINCVFIKDLPKINGYILASHLSFTYFSAGTRVCEYMHNIPILREAIERGDIYLKQDYSVSADNIEECVIFTPGHKLSTEEIEFFSVMGVKEIHCKKSATQPVIVFTLEREVIGNRSYLDAGGNWQYTYDTDTISITSLNIYDMIAIVSMLGRIYSTGDNHLCDKDLAYMKRVDLVNETFSRNFRKAANIWLNKYSGIFRDYVQGIRMDSEKNIFWGLYDEWKKQMIESRVLLTADTINVLAEVSQVNHVVSLMSSSSEIPDDVRRLAIPYFGKICPFETPAGKKLGLVNTKALGARVIDGVLCTPYRRVIHEGNSCYIDDQIIYLSARKERRYCISSFTKLEFESDGKHFKNTTIAAIVPNPNQSASSVVFAMIKAYQLDYVTCHTEQHISAAVSFVPFAQHDDATRITYGVSMLKQSIYLQHSDKPRVQTFMYRDVYKNSNSFLIRAEKDGTVVDICRGIICVLYDNDSDITDIKFKESRITNDSVLFMDCKVLKGERFKVGDILADCQVSQEGVYSPARNVLVAYVSTGYNYEDGIDIVEDLTYDYISVKNEKVESKVYRKRSQSVYAGPVNEFLYVTKGSPAFDITVNDTRDNNTHSDITVVSANAHGLLYNVTQFNEKKASTFVGNLIAFNRLGEGDKMAGRHGNKGTVTHITPTSKALMLKNGKHIQMMLNPLGVPSRMNLGQILEVHCGLCAVVSDTYIQTDCYNDASVEDIRLLMHFLYEVANSDESFEVIADRYRELPPDYIEHCRESYDNITEWRDTFDENGDALLWDPATQTWLDGPVTIGYAHMLKLLQEGEEKEHARSGPLDEPYSIMTYQPPKGSSKMGGQRNGEMELVNLVAHGAKNFLKEVCSVKSDDVCARVNAHLEALGYPQRVPEEFCVSRSYEMLSYLLEVLGIKLDVSEEPSLPNLDYQYAHTKYTYDIQTFINQDSTSDTAIDAAVSNVLDKLDRLFNKGGSN